MNLPQTQLIVATESAFSLEYALHAVQKVFCTQNKQLSCLCADCHKIKSVQHHGLLLVNPTDAYTLEDLEAVFALTTFSRAENEPFFIILSHAELFSASVGNRLLKLLEEPSANYYFILTTTNEERVLTTIRSRCSITRLENNNETIAEHPLVVFFTAHKIGSVISFEEALKNPPHHTTSHALITQLLALYSAKHTASIQAPSDQATHELALCVAYLKQALQRPPQQGSSELFWKNFYLGFPLTR